MLGLFCVLAVGTAAAVVVWAELYQAAALASQVPPPRELHSTGECDVTLSYRFSGFEPVPEGADVSQQFLEVSSCGLPIRPVVPMRLDATEVTISVPRNCDIEVIRCWVDDAGNVSRSEPISFSARDTVPPPRPPLLGEPELVGEDD